MNEVTLWQRIKSLLVTLANTFASNAPKNSTESTSEPPKPNSQSEPLATRATFERVVGKVINLEGGYSDNPNDTGNWTGGEIGLGVLKGTKYGISAASYPDLDIENLTKEQAVNIYYKDFWLAMGCNEMPRSFAFLHFDSTIQHGPYYSRMFLRDSDGHVWSYFAERLEFYAGLRQFYQEDGNPNNDFGRGWTRRMSGVAAEIAALKNLNS